MDWLQKLDIITPLEVEETAEWCNSFVLIPKANGKVRLCLDPVRVNQALNWALHRGPMLNDIQPRLNNVKYMLIIDASSGYHNLKLDEKSSDLTTFACPLAGISISDLYSEQCQQVTCSSANVMKYSVICQTFLASWMIFWL